MRTKRLLTELLEPLGEISETLHRMEARMDRGFGEMDRGFGDTRAAVENNTRVTREIVLELREQRPILDRIDHGVQSSNEGLMHVLDELRNERGGPGPAPGA